MTTSYVGTAVTSLRQLTDYHAAGETPTADQRIGTEYEKIVTHRTDGARLGYESEGRGRAGIQTLLGELSGCCGWKPKYEGDAVVALVGREASVTLEPGGQFELSGAPVQTIHETVAELKRHEAELEHLSELHPVSWMWVGMDPLHGLDEIRWMPKARYQIMRDYLPTRGGLALWMMKATCTVQANVDYPDEVGMGKRLRASMGVSSIVTAMFANSPFRRGTPSGFKSFRAHIWTDTDPDRCGLLQWVFDGSLPTYERYVRWAVEVPLFFIERDGAHLKCAGLPFSTFMARGFEGHGPTEDDWELHLSTLFPEVRLKRYLEMRSADCVAPDLLPALPALWKGLVYDDGALEAAWDLVKAWTWDERVAHSHAVARHGLAAAVPGARYDTSALASELLDIAAHGLSNLAAREAHEDEARYLQPLMAEVRAGRCPADHSLQWYASLPAAARTPSAFLDHYAAAWSD